MKKLVSLALAAVLSVASFAALAAEEGIMPISEQTENFTSITVNGKFLEGKKTITVNDKVMIPLRAITEALGFEVTWNPVGQKIELIRMPVYITCSAGADGYSFSKTAPMMLGSAPVIFEKTIPNDTPIELNKLSDKKKETTTKDNKNKVNVSNKHKQKANNNKKKKSNNRNRNNNKNNNYYNQNNRYRSNSATKKKNQPRKKKKKTNGVSKKKKK